MTRPIQIPDSIPGGMWPIACFMRWLQLMMNRWSLGGLRYGAPSIRKRYLSRLKTEIAAYEATGNMEHLLNAAVYCFLESEKPENERFHFDPTVDSVTRGPEDYNAMVQQLRERS